MDEDKDKEIAKLKAACEDYEKKGKAMEEDHDKTKAKLKAMQVEVPATPGPVVKAIVAGMDEDKKEEAKKAAMDEIEKSAMDEEHKKEAKKAMEEIFDTGNGTNTNAQYSDHEKEKDAVIASLTAKAAEPLITNILSAKKFYGASEEDLKAEKTALIALNFPALEKEYKTQKVYIDKAMTASIITKEGESLTATFEKNLDFNGAGGMALTGKAVNIDEALEEAAAQ